MKKIILLVFAVISALFLFTSCPNAAGGSSASTGSGNGTPPGEIDYAARLIGTWQTEGYDEDQYFDVADNTSSPPLTYQAKVQIIILDKLFVSTQYAKNSSNTEKVKNGKMEWRYRIASVSANTIQLHKGITENSSLQDVPHSYQIKSGKLYLNNAPIGLIKK